MLFTGSVSLSGQSGFVSALTVSVIPGLGGESVRMTLVTQAILQNDSFLEGGDRDAKSGRYGRYISAIF